MTTRQFEYNNANYLLDLIATTNYGYNNRIDRYNGYVEMFRLKGKSESLYEKFKRIAFEPFFLTPFNRSLVSFGYGRLLKEDWESEPEIISSFKKVFKEFGSDSTSTGLLEKSVKELKDMVCDEVKERIQFEDITRRTRK